MGSVAFTNRRDVVVSIHPGLEIAGGAQAGKVLYSGAWRGFRATMTPTGTYTTGGDNIISAAAAAGIKHLEQVLIVAGQLDTTAVNSDAVTPKYVLDGPNAGKIQYYSTSENTEVADATDLTGKSWDVIVLGRNG